MKKVTLYIACYNAKEYIAGCLDAALKQTYPVDEILVIDDGPGEETAKTASGYPVRIIRRKNRGGLVSARNIAIREARNEFVASFDSDCLPDPDWLERLMGNFTSEDIAGAGGKCIEKHTDTLADKWRAAHMRQHWGDEKLTNPYCLFGANNVVRKSAILEIGLYNEKKCIMSFEDVDMSKRLMSAGYKLIYEPKAIVYHLRRDKLFSLLRTHWIWGFLGTEGLRVPDNLYNLLCKIYDNFIYMFRRMKNDIWEKRFYLLHIDILIFFHHFFSDCKYYLSLKWRKICSSQS